MTRGLASYIPIRKSHSPVLAFIAILLVGAGSFFGQTSNFPLSSHYSPTPNPDPMNRPPQPMEPMEARIPSIYTIPILPRAVSSNFAKTFEGVQRTLSLHETAGDKIAQGIAHAGFAILYVQNGDLDRVSQQRSLADRIEKEAHDPKLQADVLKISAARHVSLLDFRQTIETYQRAMRIFESRGDQKGQAEVRASIGWVDASLGKIPDALDSYDAALTLFRKLGDKDGEVRTLIGEGLLYQSIGEFERALSAYKKAVIANASKPQEAMILASVGDMNLSLNNVSAALGQYHLALSLAQESDDRALQGAILTGAVRCLMAFHYHFAGKDSNPYDNGISNETAPLRFPFLASQPPMRSDKLWTNPDRKPSWDFEASQLLYFLVLADADMVKAGNQTGEAGVLATIGELDYSIAIDYEHSNRRRYFSQAIENYKKALSLMRQGGDQLGEVGVLTGLGLVFDARGNYSEALNYYRDALNLMDQIQAAARIGEFRINIASQSASLYQRAILLEIRLHHPEEAFNLSERARARSLLDQLGNRRIDGRSPHEFLPGEQELWKRNSSLRRSIGQELSKSGPVVDENKLSALESQQQEVQRLYLERVRARRIQNPPYASFLSVSPLTLHEVQQQLPGDITAVSYFTTPSVTLAFVVTKHGLHVSKLPIDESLMTATIRNFLDFSSENEVHASLMLLHKALINPIKSQLKTSRLAFVPHGVLNDLAFTALTQDGRRYLGDDFATFSLPSLSALPYLRARKKSASGQALVVANDWQEGLPFLGNAYGEAHDVATILGAEPLLGDEATVSLFQERAEESEIIHLIAHIDHDRNNPEVSRVILGYGKDEEGALELDQVLDLDLKKTNLVVLSGCQSQTGKRSRNDDIIGLTRAFIYAGSPSVIASLWSVDDEATRALMVSFYTHLKEGLGKAEALRAAQIDVRQKYPNPYYWAGFVLTGDPGSATAADALAQTKN